MSERRLRWDVLVPDRRAWLRLIAAPTSYLLLLALAITMAAKLGVVRGLHGVGWVPLRWFLACSVDIALLVGLAAVLALGEHVSRWMLFATVPLALVVAAVAVINAGYLSISGDQLTWQIFTVGLERFGDVKGIVGGTLLVSPVKTLLALLVLVGAPVAATLLLRRAGAPRPIVGGGVDRARAAGWIALVAATLTVVAPAPRRLALAKVSTSGVARMYWGLVSGQRSYVGGGEQFAGISPTELVDPAALATLRAGARPNVLLVILESTRRDVTTLPGGSGRAQTPSLVALAARGTDVQVARAAFPHTTKSVWSMLCARLPMMQNGLYETTPLMDAQCLPRILADAGWRTGFFQSATGVFEDRPRLVDRLGYATFLAAEHITKELLGYLATEDDLLVPRVAAWLDAAPGPFFATVLTSGTHHPYQLAAAQVARARAAGRPIDSDQERYERQIEEADRMIGLLVAALRERGLLERTIIVVVGDHGEGFGDKGIKQHDSNYFEEGLRVPWVMAGPGVAHQTLANPVSLPDVAPTLLGLLGVQLGEAAARSTTARDIIATPAADRVLPFGCFFDSNCRGFVRGSQKVVFVPETGQAFAFDLARDPDEESPGPVPEELEPVLDTVHDMIDSHRTPQSTPRLRPVLARYPQWSCPQDLPCRAIDPVR